MKAISLFSGAGVGESRLGELGISVVAANEFVPDRAELFKQVNPDTPIVLGDIRDKDIKNQIIEKASGIDLLIATPPCQGVSVAGSNRNLDSKLKDPRNYLLFDVIDMILRLEPRDVIIENVPQFVKLLLPINGNLLSVPEVLKVLLGHQYSISWSVLDASDFGVPQSRKRAFIHLSREKAVDLGESLEKVGTPVTLRDAIWDLPSLEAGENSGIPWHFARKHSKEHVAWMRHTPTGLSAFDNEDPYKPVTKDGRPIKAFNTTYRRMEWDKPATAITMRNDAISSQANVHPGRQIGKSLYSDARVLTPRELLLVNSMDLGSFEALQIEENLLRRVLGEGIPPLLLNAVIEGVASK